MTAKKLRLRWTDEDVRRFGLLVLILMKVVGAGDAGRAVCKNCFRDVVRDAQCRQMVLVTTTVTAVVARGRSHGHCGSEHPSQRTHDVLGRLEELRHGCQR